jgi:hypothetical protein
MDSADTSSFAFSSGSNISTWRNKANNTNFTQGGTAARLTLTTNNSRNTVFFNSDGTTNAFMNATLPLVPNTTIIQVLTPLAYGNGTWSFLWSWATNGSGTYVPGFRSLNSSPNFEPYMTWFGNNNNSISVTNGTTYLSFVQFTNSGANVSQSINGNLTPNSGTMITSNFASQIFILGGDGQGTPNIFGRMFLSEFIMYSRAITSNERQQVESYLAQKWGLTTSLPGGHLNATRPAGVPASAPSVPLSRIAFAPFPQFVYTFAFTGSNQTLSIPADVTSINVYMWGAGGGRGLGAGSGGAGVYVQGILSVTPGETLTVIVGQGGANKPRSFGKSFGGGGAGGGPDNGRNDIPSSQGGGRSAIRRSTTDIVTAGAGGGSRGSNGGRGGLISGANGSSGVGGSQTAGGANNGALNSGGDANQDNSAGGGSGFYGGGGATQDQSGGGGSSLTSNLTLLPGEATFGTESSNGILAPQTSSPYYRTDVGFGGTSAYGYGYGNGGNGLVVVTFSSKLSLTNVSPSGLIIIDAWFGSVAYRFGLSVTTTVNNAYGGNRNNSITLNTTTFTDPQVGVTKFTYIVYSFNGIQKFSTPYAEGTVLTFTSLT